MSLSLKNLFQTSLNGLFLVFLLIGCTNLSQTIKDLDVSQKYIDFKGAIKKKLSPDDTKSASLGKTEPSAAKKGRKTNHFVYKSQWSWETLSCIAAWFTGDAENWKALAKANPKLNPDRIAAGTSVYIAADLLKTTQLPSQAYIAQYRPDYFEHKVRWQGETLSLIAKWYTGRFKNWKALAQTNPNLNPNRIIIGNIILIPPDLLKTHEPLPQKVAAKRLPNYFAHMVLQPGEKLTDIAKRYTGDPKNWQALAKANPDLDPELLLVGNEIFIPSNLLKTRKPIPQSADRQSAPEPEKKSPRPKASTQPPKEKKIQLFGPKQFPKG